VLNHGRTHRVDNLNKNKIIAYVLYSSTNTVEVDT
jgi:hypothetical protein